MKGNLSWDPVWEKIFTESAWGRYSSENLIQFIARHFYKLNRHQVKILELGCGSGANIWYISREGFDAYGIDGSQRAIDLASQRLNEEGLQGNLFVGDIINLPFQNNFFDGVIDVECLYANNLSNSKIILSEVKRVLKPEGKLYSRTFSEKMYLGDDFERVADNEYNLIKEGPLKDKGFVRLTSKEMAQELYGNYFDLISIDSLEYTQYNGQQLISELIIIGEKK